MSVIKVEEKTLPNSSADSSGKYTYQRKFIVIFDTRANAGPKSAELAIPVSKGDYYQLPNGEFDTLAHAMSISCQPIDESTAYEVTVDYETSDIEAAEAATPKKEIEWGFDSFVEAITQDINNEAIINSAGDPYPEPVEVERFIPTLSITRYERGYNPEITYAYVGSVNSDTFYGAAPGFVKCSDISASSVDENGITYFRVRYTFQFAFFPHHQGWKKVILDVGYNEIQSTVDENLNLTDKKRRAQLLSESTNDPIMLDGNGKKAPLDALGYPIPTWFSYKIYPSMPFGALNL